MGRVCVVDGPMKARCQPSLVRLEQSNGRDAAKLGTAVQDGNLEDEEISDQVASQLLDQRSGSSSGATYQGDVSILCINAPILAIVLAMERGPVDW